MMKVTSKENMNRIITGAELASAICKSFKSFKQEITNIAHCPMCVDDPDIFCPRDVDAKCLICDKSFCGAHISEHLSKEHLVSLNLDHCRIEK